MRFTWEFSTSKRRPSEEAQSKRISSPYTSRFRSACENKSALFYLEAQPRQQSNTTEAETGSPKELLVCAFVQESGSTSWSGRQGFGKNPAMTVTCAIKHIHWRMALTELWQPLAEWPKWLGSPHMPADLLCQRQCADKACLVHSHHCTHARTRKAKDAVQQSHYLALVLFVGATEEVQHRAALLLNMTVALHVNTLIWFWSSLLFKTARFFFCWISRHLLQRMPPSWVTFNVTLSLCIVHKEPSFTRTEAKRQ